MRALFLGLGNPLLSDDGVGLVVARQMEGRVPELDVVCLPMAGLNLLDILDGYDLLFACDALLAPDRPLGEVVFPEDGRGARHLFSSHGLDFFELLELGREAGLVMPAIGRVYGVAIGSELAFNEEPGPGLQERLPRILKIVETDVRKILDSVKQRV